MSAGADHPNRSCHHEEEEMVGADESYPGARHQDSSDDERSPPTEAVCPRSQKQGDSHITRKRQAQKHARLRLAESQAHEIENEDDRQRPVRMRIDE